MHDSVSRLELDSPHRTWPNRLSEIQFGRVLTKGEFIRARLIILVAFAAAVVTLLVICLQQYFSL